MTRVAVVGSGISGVACADALSGVADVTLIEAAARLGGHTDTH
jgi:predicted NAD/FAD-binding protein